MVGQNFFCYPINKRLLDRVMDMAQEFSHVYFQGFDIGTDRTFAST